MRNPEIRNFNDNSSRWSRVVPCGQTDRHGLTDMTQLIVAVSNLANAPVTGTALTPRVSVLSVLACENSLIMRAKKKFKGQVGG